MRLLDIISYHNVRSIAAKHLDRLYYSLNLALKLAFGTCRFVPCSQRRTYAKIVKNTIDRNKMQAAHPKDKVRA
ncbi:MAG: hypothetical protein ACRC62_11305 [Microcoleus sp.]